MRKRKLLLLCVNISFFFFFASLCNLNKLVNTLRKYAASDKKRFQKGITNSCTHLHPAPPSSFQPPPSSIQHPQQYLNQNITGNCAIFPNLGRKSKSCLFCLKTGAHSI